MKRFILHSELKPEKVDDYVRLHAKPWPELLELIRACHIHNYSIAIRNQELYTYYEYTGVDYDADMKKMDESPVMQRWWTFSKPCFLHHAEGVYYDELQEIFYTP
jgi:L-rhamnose mutarotase